MWLLLLFDLCSSPALRDLWWNRLGQAVKDERDKEPKTTTIQITYHDAATGIGLDEWLLSASLAPTEVHSGTRCVNFPSASSGSKRPRR